MGATPHKGVSSAFVAFILTLHAFTFSYSAAAPSSSDANALLKFKDSVKDEGGALSSWTSSKAPCFGGKNNWEGVVCSKGGNVWGIRMENMKLSGTINVQALEELHRLRSISFTNNNFGGPIPDFSNLKSLKGIYLANNKFEGPIDTVKWDGLRRLRKIHLEDNKFSGQIPKSLGSLDKLVELQLNGNQFHGQMPDLSGLKSLRTFNVSNNQLQGPIPPSFATKFGPTAFAGNKDLCGGPMNPCPPGTPTLPQTSDDDKKEDPNKPSQADQGHDHQNSSPSTNQQNSSPSSSSSKDNPPPNSPNSLSSKPQNNNNTNSSSDKPVPVIALVVGVVIAMVLAILIILLLLRHRNDEKRDDDHHHPRGLNHSSSHQRKTAQTLDHDEGGSVRSTASNGSRHGGGVGVGAKGGENNGKLSFLRNDRERFDLPDLLKAAAEILGSGCFGSSYKATLNNGSAVVVKRFKQMNNVGREEFQEHMRRLGRLAHPNLLPLVAFYYRKEEKLFITDPMQKGSLAVLLHGQTRGKPTMDWPTRLKVIKGVARGLAELYKELPCLVAPHGHLKSSNVLLNGAYEPALSDYGLIPLINQESAHEHLVAYKSPEYFNNGRVTKKTDVWALGILILETLTGKFPASYLQEGSQEVDMTSWVNTVVEQGYDKSMSQAKNNEGEIQKLLDIGIQCCESDVEKRLDIKETCDRIEEIKERENDDDFYSVAEGDVRSSRGMSEDFTVNIN